MEEPDFICRSSLHTRGASATAPERHESRGAGGSRYPGNFRYASCSDVFRNEQHGYSKSNFADCHGAERLQRNTYYDWCCLRLFAGNAVANIDSAQCDGIWVGRVDNSRHA